VVFLKRFCDFTEERLLSQARGTHMRKFFWGGVALILATLTVAFIGSRTTWDSSGCPSQDPEVAYDDEYVIPGDPQAVTDALPEQPVPIESPQVTEVINVLEAQLSSVKKQETSADAPVNEVFPEHNIPVVQERDESANRVMPPCIDEEEDVPPMMPYVKEASPCAPGSSKSAPSKLKRLILLPSL
jgi:hypothetical protein